MGQLKRQNLMRPLWSFLAVAMALVVLSACGADDGDGDETETSEPVATVVGENQGTEESAVEETVTDEDVVVASPDSSETEASTGPADVEQDAAGTAVIAQPDDDEAIGTPTPPIVIAAQSPVGGTPVDGPVGTPAATPNATPVADAPSASPGDGTSGASDAESEDIAQTLEEQLAALDVAIGGTTVDSCDVESFPPYTGDAPEQVTIEDVNFRSGPGTDCDPIFDDPLGANVTVEILSDPVVRSDDPEFEWIAVDVDGTVGWLAAEFLEPAG